MKRLALSITALFAVVLALLIIRALTFKSRQIHPPPAAKLQLDRNAILRRLSEAIRIQTVSVDPATASNTDAFRDFHAFLAKAFPRVHAQLTKEVISRDSLLYAWKGKDDRLKPILLMAHMDVVPVDPATAKSWTHGPFSGELAEGYVWGRGAMDDKSGTLAILEAVEHLLAEGIQPARTVYLAFGHDEETGGHAGAAKIAGLLRARGVALEFVLDEGMNILSGILPGIAAPVALIGIAEKGYLSLQLTVETAGGHSSLPPPESAIGIVSRALQSLERTPFPSRLGGAARQMFQFLGPEMPWFTRLALANLWLVDPLVRKQLAKSPLINAAIRTTVAPTIFNAGIKENILPSSATAVVNLRLLPGDSVASAVAHVRRAIADPRVRITPLPVPLEPSAVSDVGSPNFALMQRTIGQTAPTALVAPALLVAATDSQHYTGLSRDIFRFLPITLGPEDAKRYHGIDERISFEDYERCVRFYAQLIRNSQP
jgi:carboxypeptidase PM20D1